MAENAEKPAGKKTDHHGMTSKAKDAPIKKMGQTTGSKYGQNPPAAKK